MNQHRSLPHMHPDSGTWPIERRGPWETGTVVGDDAGTPVLDANGNDGSWTTRAVSDDVKLRYVNARPEEELRPIKSLLYGQHHLRHAVVICEGPTDAWKIGPGAVATFGVNYTKAQLLRMSKYPVRFVCFDSEPIAQQRAQALCEALIPFPGTTKNITLDAMDPGSASEKELRQLRRLLRGH